MGHRERVLALIRNEPAGVSDSEICRRTGISPHQQVNQICRRLADAGLIERGPGPDGILLNRPRASPGTLLAGGPLGIRAGQSPASAGTRGMPDLRLGRRPLVVAPCSGAKGPGARATRGTSPLQEFLSPGLWGEVLEARRRLRTLSGLDESTLVAAVDRYTGHLYQSAGDALHRLVDAGARVVIISGAYGIVDPMDPIGMYDRKFRPSDWPNRLIHRCLAAVAESFEADQVVGVLAASSPYAQVFRSTPWRRPAVLATPERGPGAQVKAPRAQGEALAMLASGGIPVGWRSSDGLRLEAARV